MRRTCKKEKDIVNLNTFRETKDISRAERRQRIFNWKVETQIEFIEQGRVSDGADCFRAMIVYSTTEQERTEAKNESIQIIDELARRGYKEGAEQLRWILQKYLQ